MNKKYLIFIIFALLMFVSNFNVALADPCYCAAGAEIGSCFPTCTQCNTGGICSSCLDCNACSGVCADKPGTCTDTVGCGAATPCSQGYRCSGGSCINTGYCGYSSYNRCTSDRYAVRDAYRCDGSSNCNYDVGDDSSDCGATSYSCPSVCTRRYSYTCSGGTCGTYTSDTNCVQNQWCSGTSCTSSGYCGYSSYNTCSADICDKYRDAYRCTSGGSCSYDTGDNDPAYVASNKYCSGGTEYSGSCGSTSCSSDTCSGTCGTGTNSCVWRDYPSSCSKYCNGGGTCASCSCSYTDYDVDTSQTRCEGCKGAGYWSLGGNVSTTTCCGDDSSENKITKTCSSGICTNDTADDGCCASSSQCVNNSICFNNATSFDIDTDTNDEFCSDGMWKTKILKIGTPSASLSSVNMYNGTTDISVSITDADSNLDTSQVKISIRDPSDSVVATNGTMSCTGNAASATCNYTYDPPETGGYYDVQIYATDGIAPQVSNWFLSVFRVRGPALYRGYSYSVISTNRDENYNSPSVTAIWYLNSSEIATGTSTTWAIAGNEELGEQILNITTTKSWYDTSSAIKLIEIWDMPNITVFTNATNICPGYVVRIDAKLAYSNTTILTNQLITTLVNNTTSTSTLSSSPTNSSGYSSYNWNTSDYNNSYTINASFPGNLSFYAESLFNNSVNVTIAGALRGISITNAAKQSSTNSVINLITMGSDSIEDSCTIPTGTSTCQFCISGSKDLLIQVPTNFADNIVLKISNIAFNGTATNVRHFDETEYTGDKPIDGSITKMIFINASTFTFSNFNLSIPYDVTFLNPNVYLHCLNFDFTNNNCTSWETFDLSTLISEGKAGNTTSLVWVNDTTLSGGGFGHSKADLFVNNTSINENNSSPEVGDTVAFTITVWNIGNRAAPNVNVSCYYNDTYFGSDIINSIPPDSSQQTPRYANCTWTALEGTYNISAKADPNDDIEEYHEDNNEGGKHIVVRGLRINVTTNKTAYNASETVNATGYFTYSNGTGLSGKHVNVTFLDYASSVLQSRNVTTTSTGFFNDTYSLTQFIKSGVYTVNVTGYSTTTKQNSTTYQVYGATYGQQQHSPATYSTSSITQAQGASFDLTITWNNQGPDTAIAPNITFATNSSKITVNSSLEQCGNILSGNSCTKAVNITIASGTPPATYHVNSTVTWKNNNTVTNTSSNTTTITVGSNKILYVPETMVDGTVSAGSTKIIGYFTINSTGNDAINSINYVVTGGNLSSEWATFDPTPLIASIAAGLNRSVLVNITAPSSTSGNYWTNISVTSLDGGDDWLWLNVTIGNMILNLEAGGPYVKSSLPTVVIVGNVTLFDGTPIGPATVVLNVYDGATLKVTRTLTTSLVGKFATTINTLGVGSYDVNATATYGTTIINASDSFKIVEGSSSCVQRTVSLNGTALDYSTGQLISSGTAKIAIKENGDAFQTSFTDGRWILTFVSCLDSGRRYTAAVQVIDSTTGKSSWSEMQFMVP